MQVPTDQPMHRRTLSIDRCAACAGVSRRTIQNWVKQGKVEYVRTAGGSIRIFVDTLWRQEAADGKHEP